MRDTLPLTINCAVLLRFGACSVGGESGRETSWPAAAGTNYVGCPPYNFLYRDSQIPSGTMFLSLRCHRLYSQHMRVGSSDRRRNYGPSETLHQPLEPPGGGVGGDGAHLEALEVFHVAGSPGGGPVRERFAGVLELLVVSNDSSLRKLSVGRCRPLPDRTSRRRDAIRLRGKGSSSSLP